MSEPIRINCYACQCGAQSEGERRPCWSCGGEMHVWRVREAHSFGNTIEAATADRRTANGGY